MENTQQNKQIPVLGSFLVVIAVIIGTVLLINKNPEVKKQTDDKLVTINVAPVDEHDHILGSKDADVVIIEWSDSECPFCKKAHPEVKEVLKEFGDKVAFVYRHFPLEGIHPNARREAHALECVAKLSNDNTAFFSFLDTVFAIEGDGTESLIEKSAENFGIKNTDFKNCMSDDSINSIIDQDIALGKKSGVEGTPAFFYVSKKGTIVPAFGLQDANDMKSIVNQLLNM